MRRAAWGFLLLLLAVLAAEADNTGAIKGYVKDPTGLSRARCRWAMSFEHVWSSCWPRVCHIGLFRNDWKPPRRPSHVGGRSEI
jgi:hypothetical protein